MDVAVLSISTFEITTPPDIIEFSEVVENFLAACRSAGKTRLIVGVRQNPGKIYLVYDAFKQLFPTIIPYPGWWTRDHHLQTPLRKRSLISFPLSAPASSTAQTRFPHRYQSGSIKNR